MDSDKKIELRRLFDNAAAKSLAMECSLDAESEMAEFVRFARTHPQLKDDVTGMVRESFSDDFYMKRAPVELWQYCAHFLQWSELLDTVKSLRDADIVQHGAARSNVWDNILEASDKDWEGAQYFKPISK